MERYHIYKLGIAILFYAIYCRRPMLVNGLDVVGSVNNKSTSRDVFNPDRYVYYQGVQGTPGVDFPVYARIPRTGFSCKEMESGYYADLETDCQVFHICNDGIKVSFLCPNGTIFQQSELICDWWFKVNCTNSPNLYEESAEQLRESHIRRKASRRVSNRGDVNFTNRPNKPQIFTVDHKQFSDRKMDITSKEFVEVPHTTRGGRKYGNQNRLSDSQSFKKNTFNYEEPGSSEEMQITQETASFFKSNYNNIESSRKNPYPNHRSTYADIQDPKNYYTNLPSTSSVTPRGYQRNALNNGQPFVVSTPKLGVYTTEKNNLKYSPTVPAGRTTFKYSPTVPTTAKPTSIPVSTVGRDKFTYGTRTSPRVGKSESNSYNSVEQSNSSQLPKAYNNFLVETFTNPPTVANGKSTASRKTKGKSSFTIGLNSVQGSIAVKSHTQPIHTQTESITTTKNPTTPKKNTFKINLSSDGGAKPIKPKARAYDDSKVIRLNLSSGQVKPLHLSVENEIPASPATNRPSTGFFVTKTNTFRPGEYITSDFNAGSITGSKNTYIPTTIAPAYTTFPTTAYTEYHSNTFGFVKPTGFPKPKPFQLASSTSSPTTYDVTFTTEAPQPTILPNYQISSASPFTNVPPTLPSSYQTYTTPKSTYPTVYTAAQGFTTAQPVSENIHNMLDTLKEIANVRVAKEEDFDAPRPGLIVPPSVGPQTLHTLAVYFANALDSLVVDDNGTETQTESEIYNTEQNENSVINSLLSKDTVNKYHDLFKDDEPKETQTDRIDTKPDDEEEVDTNDLDSEHTNNAVQSPRVRQLAKVFTQALSSYLDDPDTFRRVLQEIRPTEPPPLQTLPTDTTVEEDELLNFSDADIKPENPRLPTPPPANPTWGYILALNSSEFKTNNIDNSVGEVENLQSADSQSFVPGYNDISTNRVNKALRADATKNTFETTTLRPTNEEITKKSLPINHWTSSPDATKLWQTTLFVNPFSINHNFDAPEITSSSKEVDGGEDLTDETTTASYKHESHDDTSADTSDTSADLSEFVTDSVIDYELHSLPKLDLNSTEVHGILIDFMNSTKNEDSSKLQRILSKLNTTEDQFLAKMKEIEQNPLTRRLILLLINECGNSKSLETKAHAVRDIITIANSRESLHPSSTNVDSVTQKSPLGKPSGFRKLIDPNLKDEDQDTRALQLLNSLYSIASKYGK